jgi:hypothetical protein
VFVACAIILQMGKGEHWEWFGLLKSNFISCEEMEVEKDIKAKKIITPVMDAFN